MLPLVLDELVAQVKNLLRQPPLEWRPCEPAQADMALFEQEASEPSKFDPLGLKRAAWTAYAERKVPVECTECALAKIYAILPKDTKIPTDDWGRLFQWLGPPKDGGQWKVFWMGTTTPRNFPAEGQPLGAEHLNGGYTTGCSNRGIFIYRQEEATRVLVHEMLHAACLDPPVDSIPIREATTETWAELFLVAYRSRGVPGQAARLWALQSQWIADTNQRSSRQHNVRGNAQYGWRYLNGREIVLADLGILLPAPSKGPPPISSRFTHPALGH